MGLGGKDREHPFHPQPSNFLLTYLWNEQRINTPETWSEGEKLSPFTGGITARLPAVSTCCEQCIQRCKSLAIWFMLMCPSLLLLSLHWLSSFHCVSVAIVCETGFYSQKVDINGFLMSGAVGHTPFCSSPIGKVVKNCVWVSYILPYLNLHCPLSLSPSRDMKYWLLASGPAAPTPRLNHHPQLLCH